MTQSIDARRVADMIERETERFTRERPRTAALLERGARSMPGGVPMAWMRGLTHHMPIYVAEGTGASFTDVDGHRYLDFNQADMSSSIGYANRDVLDAMAEQSAKGVQFLLPVEDAVEVSEALARRFGVSHWQYTLSASSANTEAIRLARLKTGRDRVLMFDGSYHGHIGETMLGEHEEGDDTVSYALGLPSDHGRHTSVVPFNDLEAAEAVLSSGTTACVIAEPALTNVGLVAPQPGFFDALRKLCDRHGSLLVIDETHTHMLAYGGLVRALELEPHIVVLGKNVAGGLPIGMYGFGAELAALMDEHLFDHASDVPGLACGGTLYGNALSLAAARACLEKVLTVEGYERISTLGSRLREGVQSAIDRFELPWRAQRLMARVGWLYDRREPRTGRESAPRIDVRLSDSRRIFFANRGIWEAVVTAGPAVSFPMVEADVDRYVQLSHEWLASLVEPH